MCINKNTGTLYRAYFGQRNNIGFVDTIELVSGAFCLHLFQIIQYL